MDLQSYNQATTLRFTFHDARPGSASNSAQPSGQSSNSIEVPDVHRRTDDDFGILRDVTQGRQSSLEERYASLTL